MKKSKYIYDLETYKYMFLATFYNVDTHEWYEFEISARINQTDELREFLKSVMLIGFNNINFDYPVLHHTILSNNERWTSEQIYIESNKIIKAKYSSIWDNKTKIPQLDLFKIWHYDNKNKSTSLKWLEFAMRMENVQDLPYPPDTFLSNQEMDEIKAYCRNDVLATYQFYLKSLKHIEIRDYYTRYERINLMNASETKMAKDIFGKYLSQDLRISYNDLKQMRTFHNEIDIKDIIFPYIEFKHEENQKVLDYYNNVKWIKPNDNDSKEDEESQLRYTIQYSNVTREYGEGGLHSFGTPGIYESNDEWMVYDLDFASYYPHLTFKNKLHPEHIPEEVFNDKYEGFYKDRKTYNKSDPRNYVLKIILNSAYGLSKDKYAYLYDPKWQLAVTINGQLLLTMLSEWVVDAVSECKILFENTDGAAFLIKRSEKHLVDKVCEKMAELSGIALETQECKKLIMRDVNNYINIISDDNVKFKGAFEIDRDFHKNHSKRIVPLALANYFINNIPVDNTIKTHLQNNHFNAMPYDFAENYGIYDFCLGAKMTKGNILYARSYEGASVNDEELFKVTRYYVSNDGVELIKKLPALEKAYIPDTAKQPINQVNIFDFIEDTTLVEPEDRETNIESGYKCTVFNQYKEGPYDINYDYYINECNKIINIINQ